MFGTRLTTLTTGQKCKASCMLFVGRKILKMNDAFEKSQGAGAQARARRILFFSFTRLETRQKTYRNTRISQEPLTAGRVMTSCC